MKTSRRMLEMAVCKYIGVTSACNETAAQYFARYFTKGVFTTTTLAWLFDENFQADVGNGSV